MMLLVIKKTLNLSNILKSSTLNLLHLSNLSSASQNTISKPKFITQYLISSCGFSQEKAIKLSRAISHLTSPHQPDSVRHFLKHLKFADTQINTLITGYPNILSANVDKTLKPNLNILQSLGFPDQDLRMIIISNPRLLVVDSPLPRLNFWSALLNNDKKNLLAVFKRNRGLINHDIDRVVAPKIGLLKEYGLSEADIGMIAVRGQRFITRSMESMEKVVKRAKELGFNSNSSMFGVGVSSLSSIGSVRLKKKMIFFKGYGWSEEEFLSALKKAPFFVHLSEENVKEKMEFLVGRAGCEQSYIASNPMLLMLSLEKRLKPRYYVMEMLKEKGLGGSAGLSYIMCLSEKKFVERIICWSKENVPKVHEIYVAACAGELRF